MKKVWILMGAAFALALLFLGWRLAGVFQPESEESSSSGEPAQEGPWRDGGGVLWGRVTTRGGGIYEGRLRWGRGEEAFWGDFFNGVKKENHWTPFLPPSLRATYADRPVEILGIPVGRREKGWDLSRPFAARFGDVSRIEARGTRVRVVLKSGRTWDLDRFEPGDFDDGVGVWDAQRGLVFLDSLLIRTIEFRPSPTRAAVPARLHGTGRTPTKSFTGFLEWNREKGVGSDELTGRGPGGDVTLRLDAIRSIVPLSEGGS